MFETTTATKPRKRALPGLERRFSGRILRPGDDRVRAGYDEPTWRRLVEAKRRWDPDNAFHLNQNIPPA